MWDHRLFQMDKDGRSRYVFQTEPLLFRSIKGLLIPQCDSFVDYSNHQSGGFNAPGSVAFQESVSRMSKLAGGLHFWFTSSYSSKLRRLISGNLSVPRDCDSVIDHSPSRSLDQFGAGVKTGTSPPFVFGNVSRFITRLLNREPEKLHSLSFLSLAAALVPPIDNISAKAFSLSLGDGEAQLQASPDKKPCEVERHGCKGCSFPELRNMVNAAEPRTGIEFPLTLENILARQNNPNLASEILVATGSRTMKIIKIKSMKVYAFGFYVHPNSVCQKLGPKYASFPVNELDKRQEFFRDLLREDIGMTVRLVINCNGVKINTVRDAFEKSLRARLLKTNPDTDFSCLRTFGSFFTKDIPTPAGTTVEFRRTADGRLITEIEGNQIGVVHSKELCTAFFGMYIGDVPVSEQTKQEIGKNVASIIRKC